MENAEREEEVPDKRRRTIYLPLDIDAKLRNLAAEEDRSVSDVIADALQGCYPSKEDASASFADREDPFFAARAALKMGDRTRNVIALAKAFPSLGHMREFDLEHASAFRPDKIWEHAQRLPATPRYAIQFVLSIYNPDGAWAPIDLLGAFARWDEAHRRAARGFLVEPWWP